MPNANEEMENQCRGDRSTVCMSGTHGDLRLCNTTFGYSRSVNGRDLQELPVCPVSDPTWYA